MKYACKFPSPLGFIRLRSDGRALTGLHFVDDDQEGAAAGFEWDENARPFTEARKQVEAYFAGDLVKFDLPIRLQGTEFQQLVWEELLKVPYGQTISYGGLAARIGRPTACRAVGLANAVNPVGIIVPCHRVIGASGKLTGYGGGLPRKQALLDLERRSPSA